MLRIMLAAIASVFMIAGALAQDGARAYFLLPEGTNIASLTAYGLHTEVGATRIDTGVLTASYRRTIDIGGNAGAILIGLPIGGLSGVIDTGFGVVPVNNSLALGDLFVGGELGLFGSPALGPMEYAQHKPGFRAGVAAKLFLPTGDYSSTRLTNLGQNRWSLQASVPLSYVLADSMIDPTITTFEIVPSVHIFGDNPNAFGSVSSQDPLWQVEGHVTHTFSPMVWAALDAYAETGGRTTAGGVETAAAHQSVALGATLGLVLSPQLALRLSYVEQVYSSVSNSARRSVELTAAFMF
ncbi:MAG TPA: transporter [Devosia sp.]